jgi:3-dehydroquinate dehydratase-1
LTGRFSRGGFEWGGMVFESFVLAVVASDLGVVESRVVRERADAVEFRVDRAAVGDGGGDPVAAASAYDGELPVIATNRARWEGGEAGSAVPPSEQDAEESAQDRERLETLAAVVDELADSPGGVAGVDVELASLAVDAPGVDAVRSAASANDAAVIASSHDFDGTPTREAMRETLDDGLGHGDVAKLAVTADSRADALDLLAVTNEHGDAGDPIATMAMGSTGRHTRALAPLYGSRIAYAPLDPADATAPGQYDLATLADLIDTLDDG